MRFVSRKAAPQRILLIRLSALGDVVVTTPIIHACRQRHPGARIDFAVGEAAAPLVQHHPDLDQVVIIPQAKIKQLRQAGQWRALWALLVQVRGQLHARRYDLALDCQGLLKSGLVAWLSGAPVRIGLGSREGSNWLVQQVVARDPAPRHISGPYRDLAQTLGWPTQPFDLQVYVTDHDRQRAQQLLDGAGQYVIFCPYTTRPQKHWFEASWVALAQQLRQHLPGVSVLIVGGPDDAQSARTLAAACGAQSLAGQTSLLETAALIESAAAVVGVDTGMTHVGTAMRRPTVALFGSTCPYVQTESPLTQVLYKPLDCSPCHRHPTCGGRFDCMRLHQPAQVAEVLMSLLKAVDATGLPPAHLQSSK